MYITTLVHGTRYQFLVIPIQDHCQECCGNNPIPLPFSDTVDPWGKASIVVTDVHMVCWVPGVRHPSSSQTYTWSVGWRPPTGAVADVTICCCCDHHVCNPIHIKKVVNGMVSIPLPLSFQLSHTCVHRNEDWCSNSLALDNQQ